MDAKAIMEKVAGNPEGYKKRLGRDIEGIIRKALNKITDVGVLQNLPRIKKSYLQRAFDNDFEYSACSVWTKECMRTRKDLNLFQSSLRVLKLKKIK